MRHLLLIAILFSVMFSSTSFAEWTKVSTNDWGWVFHVDFERINEHDGNVYAWTLVDYIKQTDIGHLSDIGLFQVDCKLLRTKRLKWLFYREPMGQGDPLVDNTPDENWEYWQPNSSGETAFMSICDYVN